MPELPEVETVRRVLERDLSGRTIKDITIRYLKIIENDADDFKKCVIGKKIMGIDRYGKYLIFKLSEGFILSHLRMEGKYFYLDENEMDNKHIHVIYHLDNGKVLMYQDVRKFGRMEYLLGDIYHMEPLSLMGPDLVLNDEIDVKNIYHKIKKKDIPIKSILLDQTILSGLGNIYADEVLFEAKIRPLRSGKSMRLYEVEHIIDASRRILLKSIEEKGCTIRSYTSSLGVLGNYQNFLQVHTKCLCPNCKSDLIRVKIDNRMTYYCRTCQR